ncbi:uncharacterized protein LOC113290343 [Papaver somniferum]|uniref:uncharacterized protein LOC113290343 n=1 Tax=Papaver somniferum TaxID=3469 RepID=UPI000E703DBC|nr:uncharacterized protein LOC113290343 [Papaver somniferum]
MKDSIIQLDDSEEDDSIEELQEKSWIDERRLKSTQNPYSSLPEYKLKADIPPFNGNCKLEDLLDWFYEVEAFFDFMEVPDHSKIKLVAYKLKGGAAAWWKKLGEDRRNAKKPPIKTWERIRNLMRLKFLPQDYRQQLFLKLQSCRQRARLVEEYVAEFYNLIARNQLKESEEQLVARFIDELNNLIQQSMTQSVFTMVEVVQQALKIERRVLQSTKATPTRSSHSPGNYISSYSRYTPPQHNYVPASSVLYQREDNIHYSGQQQQPINFTNSPLPVNSKPFLATPNDASQVPDPQSFQQQSTRFNNRHQNSFPPQNKPHNAYAKYIGDKCNKCNPTGQTSGDFRKFNGFVGNPHSFTNDQEDVTASDTEKEEEDDTPYEIHGSFGGNYLGMIRSLLLSRPCHSQRHSILKSQCEINGKICDMIIDSGSVENYVSSYAVKKLGLPVTKHPEPYIVGWVNGSSTKNIVHQCFVRFSFPEYEDSALCDVIDMSATHILLRRSWELILKRYITDLIILTLSSRAES